MPSAPRPHSCRLYDNATRENSLRSPSAEAEPIPNPERRGWGRAQLGLSSALKRAEGLRQDRRGGTHTRLLRCQPLFSFPGKRSQPGPAQSRRFKARARSVPAPRPSSGDPGQGGLAVPETASWISFQFSIAARQIFAVKSSKSIKRHFPPRCEFRSPFGSFQLSLGCFLIGSTPG